MAFDWVSQFSFVPQPRGENGAPELRDEIGDLLRGRNRVTGIL